MVRSIAAIVIGFVLIAVLSLGSDALLRSTMPDIFAASGRVDSVPVLLMIIGYVFVFAVAGCFLAARLALKRPLLHALVLGLLGLAFSVPVTMANWNAAPAWYHIVSLLLVMPAAWLGGWLRENQISRQGGFLPSVNS